MCMRARLLYYLRNLARYSLLCLCVLLCSCAYREYSGPQQPELLEQWTRWGLVARLRVIDSVTNAQVAGRMLWRQCHDDYDMRVRGPFNITVMRLFTHEGGVSLERLNRDTTHGTSAEQLSQELLGATLPFSSFPYWMKGVFAPELAVSGVVRSDGRLQRWQQDSWDIRILSYRGRTGLLLPERMVMKRGVDVIELDMRRWRARPSCTRQPPATHCPDGRC